MPIPEVVMGKLMILGADIATDIIMDMVAEARAQGKTELTVEELEAFAEKWKSMKQTETDKIRARLSGVVL